MDMTLVLIVGAVVLVVIAVLGYLEYRARAQRGRNREIARALKQVAKDAGQLGVHARAPAAGPPNEALQALQALAPFYPEKVTADIKKIEALWKEMSSQLNEFTQQPPRSTLQSSLITTRTMKMAEEIRVLSENVQRRLSL